MDSVKASTKPPRVLIVSATVGSGHNSVAQALTAQLQLLRPQVHPQRIDALSYTPRLFRACYAGGFALGMTRLPTLYGLCFTLTDRPNTPTRGFGELLRLQTERRALGNLRQWLLENPFDLIVHTHFIAPPMVAWMQTLGLLSTPQWVVVTDIRVHRYWFSRNVSHWFVPAECSAETFTNWGVDPNTITVSGIPIHPKWSPSLDRRKILSHWNLPTEKKILLLSGGTEFTCGPIVKIARRLAATCPQAYVVILAGRNKKLLSALATLDESPERLIGVGYTDRVHELVEVSSMMITKAGGVTTAECLARGTPMVLLKPIPGQEGGNADYFSRQKAAVVTQSLRDVLEVVPRLLAQPAELKHLAQNAQRLYRPGAETVAKAILSATIPLGS